MKNYKRNFIFATILTLSFIIIVPVLIYFLLFKYEIGFGEAKRIAEMEVERYLTDNEFSNYYSDNQRYTDIYFYALDIDLNIEEKTIDAYAVIKGVVEPDSITRLDFNFYDGFEIDYVKLNGKKTKFNYDDNRLAINDYSAIVDSFVIEVKYFGEPSIEGFGSFVFGRYNETGVVYTINEPVYASTWFPCNDFPYDKAFLDIKIRNYEDYISISNGKLVNTYFEEGKKVYHYKTEYPISTYLIALNSGKYEVHREKMELNGDSLDIEYYFLPGKKEQGLKDLSLTEETIRIFSEMFGEYPFIKEKYGIVEILWKHGAIENQTIVGVGENFISGFDFYRDLFIHEVAHHWWGNAVGPATWRDTWLNEGFSTYSEALFWEKKAGWDALVSTMYSKKNEFSESPLYNPSINIFSNLIYNKGAWVLHMLRFEVGDEIFFKILKEYYQQYKYSSAKTTDFIEVCEKISNKNLSQFFEQWVLNGIGNIKLNYSLSSEGNSSILKLKQVQDDFEKFEFPLEIDFYNNGSLFATEQFYINSIDTIINYNSFQPADSLAFDPNSWLLAEFEKIVE